MSTDAPYFGTGEPAEQLATWSAHSRGLVREVGFSPDGRTLASSGYDCIMKLWSTSTRELRRAFGLGLDAETVPYARRFEGNPYLYRGERVMLSGQLFAFASDGMTIASAETTTPTMEEPEGSLKLRDAQTGDVIRIPESVALNHETVSLALSPDGARLANAAFYPSSSASLDRVMDREVPGHFEVWDARTGDLLWSRGVEGGGLGLVSLSPDGNTLACVADIDVTIRTARTGTEIRRFSLWGSGVRGLVFSPSGELLASTGYAYAKGREAKDHVEADEKVNKVHLWNASTGELRHALEGEVEVYAPYYAHGLLAFSPSGEVLASPGYLSADKSTAGVLFWDTRTGELLGTIAHSKYVTCLTFSPDGEVLATGCNDGTITLWSLGRREKERTGEYIMRRVRVEDDILISVDRYYLSNDPASPYYKVFEDTETQSITFVDPKNSASEEWVLQPFRRARGTIEEMIFDHMRKRGYPVPDRIVEHDQD